MTNSSLKIDQAQYVITVDDRRRVIRDGSVVVRNGRITHVGKADELSHTRRRPGNRRHRHGGDARVPERSHAYQLRTLRPGRIPPDDVSDRLRHVFAMQSVMTEEEEYLTTLLGVEELLGTGTTHPRGSGHDQIPGGLPGCLRPSRMPGGDRRTGPGPGECIASSRL